MVLIARSAEKSNLEYLPESRQREVTSRTTAHGGQDSSSLSCRVTNFAQRSLPTHHSVPPHLRRQSRTGRDCQYDVQICIAISTSRPHRSTPMRHTVWNQTLSGCRPHTPVVWWRHGIAWPRRWHSWESTGPLVQRMPGIGGRHVPTTIRSRTATWGP